MTLIKSLWHRHLAAWHRVDAYLARQRGDLNEAIEHGSKADRELANLHRLTGRIYH